MYTVCAYRDGAMVAEQNEATRDGAELMALGFLREGAEVTIYKGGRALSGWFRRVR